MISNSEMLEEIERVLDCINERGIIPKQILTMSFWGGNAVRLSFGEPFPLNFVVFGREEIEFPSIQRPSIKVVDQEGDVDPKLAKTLERLYEKAKRAVSCFQERPLLRLFQSVPRDCLRYRQ